MVSWSSIVRPAAQLAKYRTILQTPAVKNGKIKIEFNEEYVFVHRK